MTHPLSSSPLSFRNFFTLALYPATFFNRPPSLIPRPSLFLSLWLIGTSIALLRLQATLFKEKYDTLDFTQHLLTQLSTASWQSFWLYLLIGGTIGGLSFWWGGGWWFHRRLLWAGALNPDKTLARHLMVTSALVYALPCFLIPLIQTAFYPTYTAAYLAEPLWALPFFSFHFLSIATSFIAVRNHFTIHPGGCKLWFLYLPGAWYIVLTLLTMLFIYPAHLGVSLTYTPPQVYTDLRTHLLSSSQDPEARDHHIIGILIESGDSQGITALAVHHTIPPKAYLSDGSSFHATPTSAQALAAAQGLLDLAPAHLKYFTRTTTFPLAHRNSTTFYVITNTGIYSVKGFTRTLLKGNHKLTALFRQAQTLLHALENDHPTFTRSSLSP